MSKIPTPTDAVTGAGPAPERLEEKALQTAPPVAPTPPDVGAFAPPATPGEKPAQSAPPVAPTPPDVGERAPSGRGVNPGATDESAHLHKGVEALDAEGPSPAVPRREVGEGEFATDPDTGGLPADHVRVAGTEEMDLPPEKWEQVDEESDESFPASDPPGNY